MIQLHYFIMFLLSLSTIFIIYSMINEFLDDRKVVKCKSCKGEIKLRDAFVNELDNRKNFRCYKCGQYNY